MRMRKYSVTVVAAVGFLVLLAGAGLPGTTASDSHQSHHPQASEGKAPATAICPAHPQMAGGMMSGMMTGMMGNGMNQGMAGMGQEHYGHEPLPGCTGGKTTS